MWFGFFLSSRRLKGGIIEPHPTENALIINYTLEATVFNEPGDAMLEKSKVRIRMSVAFGYLLFRDDVFLVFVLIGVKKAHLRKSCLRLFQMVMHHTY